MDQIPDSAREIREAKAIELTFEELTNLWLRDCAEVHKAPSSIIRGRQLLRDYLLPSIGSLKLSSVNFRDIVQMQDRLHKSEKIGPKSVNIVVGLCHKIFADDLILGLCANNTAHEVKRIRGLELDHKYWTFDECDRFLNFAKPRNREIHDLVTFVIHTGLRRGEVEGLLRDSLDFDRQEITVKRNFCHKTNCLNEYTQGKTIRRVPMNDEVFDVLTQFRLLAPSQKVFHQNFQHIVRRYLVPLEKEAGVREITFHDFRHSIASHLAMSGVSIFDIKKLLGHSDIKTTMRYMHLAPDHLRGSD